MAAWLFRWRGVLLAAVGLAVASLAHPTSATLLAAFPLLGVGILLRGWAFSHLGSVGRTRSSEPPDGVVRSGPYGWFSHPVYAANLFLCVGLTVSAGLSWGATAATGAALALFYLTLARRESDQLRGLRTRSGASLGVWAVARSERSTWLSVGLLLIAQGLFSSVS